MKISRYYLTKWGKIGVALFWAAPPIAAFYALPAKLTDGQKRLLAAGIPTDIATPSPTILILLATASMVGLVLMFLGRELVTTEE